MLPDSEVRKKFESAIDQAAQAITEGRDAVQNLRASTVVTNDLAEAIGTLANELTAGVHDAANTPPPVVDIAVEGEPRDLHPLLRDDIYRIAGEALRNAFRHAGARRIEIALRYDNAQLQVRVRDDGKGMSATSPGDSHPGHFGLPGMRERAAIIGGRLDVWSKVGLGTEVELTIPAAKAYAAPRSARRRWSLFARKTGTDS
jgi:signal transduction histidine kinase